MGPGARLLINRSCKRERTGERERSGQGYCREFHGFSVVVFNFSRSQQRLAALEMGKRRNRRKEHFLTSLQFRARSVGLTHHQRAERRRDAALGLMASKSWPRHPVRRAGRWRGCRPGRVVRYRAEVRLARYAKDGCGAPDVPRCSMFLTAVCNSTSERRIPKSPVSTSLNASLPLIVRRSTSPDG